MSTPYTAPVSPATAPVVDSKHAALVGVVKMAVDGQFSGLETKLSQALSALARLELEVSQLRTELATVKSGVAQLDASQALGASAALPAAERKTGRGASRGSGAKRPATGVPSNALIYFKNQMRDNGGDYRSRYGTTDRIERFKNDPALIKNAATKDAVPSQWWSAMAGCIWKELSQDEQAVIRASLQQLKAVNGVPAAAGTEVEPVDGDLV